MVVSFKAEFKTACGSSHFIDVITSEETVNLIESMSSRPFFYKTKIKPSNRRIEKPYEKFRLRKGNR